jgi:hypothetical protein
MRSAAPGKAAGAAQERDRKEFDDPNSTRPRPPFQGPDRIDLTAELEAAVKRLKRSRRLPPYFGCQLIEGRFGRLPINVFLGRLFEPVAVGFEKTILAIPPDEDGEPEDLLALDEHDSSRWWLRLGRARFLGEDAVYKAMGCREPLRLWRSPLTWLRARCEGCVVVDWNLATPLLRQLDVIVAEDVAHGEEVERRLRERTWSRIVVPNRTAAA